MSNLRQRNQLFLEQQKVRLGFKAKAFDGEKLDAKKFDDSADAEGDTSFSQLIKSSNWALLHPQMFPSKEGIENFSQVLRNLDPKSGSMQYIGVTECDPHLMWSLTRIRQIEDKIGAVPDNQSTQLNFRPSLLITLGTGDGIFLQQVVNTLRPYHLCIALRNWKDLESSFETIDWCNWWNQRCESDREKISLLPYQSIEELRAGVITHALISCEHAIVIVPGPKTSSAYLDDRRYLSGHEMQVAINYLGFTIDEYNMIWNSVQTLKKFPKIFRVPSKKLGGKYIVCGSGPSLDENLCHLKNLSRDWTIIACASNYRSLRAAGIDVDILCLLERGPYEYDNYLSVKNEYGLGSTHLFASVTCDPRLHDLFLDSMVFFRPALTPLSVFSTHPAQVLNFEGPQTVNTGVAFCAALGAEEVILVGVDLGASSLEKVRSDEAVGVSQRDFDRKVAGNFQEFAYTNSLLLDGKLAMEICIRSVPETKIYNSSNGIKIEGAEPRQLRSILENNNNINCSIIENWRSWWNHRSAFDPDALRQYWQASRPRAHVSNTLMEVRSLLISSEPWFPLVQDRLHELLRLDVPVREQVGRRLCRSVLLKLAIVVSRQCYVLLAQDPTGGLQQDFLQQARQLMADLCDQLEEEIYELFDRLEAELSMCPQQHGSNA